MLLTRRSPVSGPDFRPGRLNPLAERSRKVIQGATLADVGAHRASAAPMKRRPKDGVSRTRSVRPFFRAKNSPGSRKGLVTGVTVPFSLRQYWQESESATQASRSTPARLYEVIAPRWPRESSQYAPAGLQAAIEQGDCLNLAT